jgi:hypothetical protein
MRHDLGDATQRADVRHSWYVTAIPLHPELEVLVRIESAGIDGELRHGTLLGISPDGATSSVASATADAAVTCRDMVRTLCSLVALVVVLAACGGDAAIGTTASAPPVTVDWDAVIERTRSIDSVTVRVEVGTRGGSSSGFLAVTTELDFDAAIATMTVASQGVRVVEVLVEGERSWMRLEDDAFRAALPTGVEYVEAATGDLVAAGAVAISRDATWFPLDFLRGVASSALVGEADPGRVYELRFDVGAVTAALPPETRPAFLELFGDMVDPEFISALSGRAVLDAEGRVVDLTVVATPHPAEVAGRPVDLFFRHVLDGIDEPVTVARPDPAAVVAIESIPGLREGLTPVVPPP